jgi:hypothetical protein
MFSISIHAGFGSFGPESVRIMAVCVGSGWCIYTQYQYRCHVTSRLRTNHFRAPEPTIPRVLAVFPTQRFHQPHPAAPPPTPTIATYKPFNSYLVSGHLNTSFLLCGYIFVGRNGHTQSILLVAKVAFSVSGLAPRDIIWNLPNTTVLSHSP